MSGDVILMVWLLCDVIVSAAIFAATGYFVFVRGHSGWWFIPSFWLACSFGGSRLYARLSERVKAGSSDSTRK